MERNSNMELARDIRALMADLNDKVLEAARCGISTEYYLDKATVLKTGDGPADGTQIDFQKITAHLVIKVLRTRSGQP